MASTAPEPACFLYAANWPGGVCEPWTSALFTVRSWTIRDLGMVLWAPRLGILPSGAIPRVRTTFAPTGSAALAVATFFPQDVCQLVAMDDSLDRAACTVSTRVVVLLSCPFPDFFCVAFFCVAFFCVAFVCVAPSGVVWRKDF